MAKPNQMIGALNDWASVFFRRSIIDFLEFTHKNGVSMAQITVLMMLYYDGATTILAIRQSMFGSRSAITQLVEKLVRLNLVDRSESLEDRRVKVVRLTEKGRSLVEEGIVSRQDWIQPMVEKFDKAEQDKMTEMLKSLTLVALEM